MVRFEQRDLGNRGLAKIYGEDIFVHRTVQAPSYHGMLAAPAPITHCRDRVPSYRQGRQGHGRLAGTLIHCVLLRMRKHTFRSSAGPRQLAIGLL